MAAKRFYPLAGCQASAEEMQTQLVNSVLRLFKAPFDPVASTPRADYLAAEADYKGYTVGGEIIAAWLNPILTAGVGYQINSPLVMFAYDSGDPGEDNNTISGGWLEDAGGVIRLAFTFEEDVPMQQDGQGFPLNLILPFLSPA